MSKLAPTWSSSCSGFWSYETIRNVEERGPSRPLHSWGFSILSSALFLCGRKVSTLPIAEGKALLAR